MSSDIHEKINQGSLVRMGLLSTADVQLAAELVSEVSQSDLETVRVVFADQHGVLRGKAIVASALESVFRSGLSVPGTLLLKDTSHRTVFPVWTHTEDKNAGPLRGAADVLLVPDATTFRRLPWSPHSAWLFCDVSRKDGGPVTFAPRPMLKRAMAKLDQLDLQLQVGLEVEFQVFEVTEQRREHAHTTMPGKAPLTRALAHGYQLLTDSRYASLEPVMDELRRHCQALRLPIRSMEVEMGPGQFEFTFDPADALTHADNMMMFRAMVKEVCAKQGLHASFMCRPGVENAAANGWHLHQSLLDKTSGENRMIPGDTGAVSKVAGQWIAGLLMHATESCLLTTPTINGYKRYQPYQLAPDRIQWGEDNRGAMIRAMMQPGDTASRIENRVADSAANPYYFFTSQLESGMAGIHADLKPPKPEENPYESTASLLPRHLAEAIESFADSVLYRTELGDEVVDYLVHLKRAEWDRYLSTISEWEQDEYFSLF
ncbi:MAG: glutamine synthetase family protein [Gammaproteobacteria bacterium]|nr:glutamine synthetase family protein [Gammaproteobacteria bacterium]